MVRFEYGFEYGLSTAQFGRVRLSTIEFGTGTVRFGMGTVRFGPGTEYYGMVRYGTVAFRRQIRWSYSMRAG